MLLKKQGFPEEEEFVLCTVTGINPHSVFCTLDEYGGRTGMIHISEIAPGRIRNIKEYVSQGKKIVVKILQINKERGHIDLSLRRVNEAQKRTKLNQIKQEQFAEKIIGYAAKQQGESPLVLYNKLSDKLVKDHGTLFNAFEKVSKGELKLEDVIDKKIAGILTEVIQSRIKPPEVRISGALSVTSFAFDGVQEIKDALAFAAEQKLDVRYLGAGNYRLEVVAEDYKTAEKKLKSVLDPILKFAEEHDMIATWVRKEE